MKSKKNGVRILIVLLILGMIGLLVWYTTFYLQNTDILTDVTLVVL